MFYHELMPGPAVCSFVKCYWILEDECPSPAVQTMGERPSHRFLNAYHSVAASRFRIPCLRVSVSPCPRVPVSPRWPIDSFAYTPYPHRVFRFVIASFDSLRIN